LYIKNLFVTLWHTKKEVMPNKSYKNPEDAQMVVADSAVSYRTGAAESSPSLEWRPNVIQPCHMTVDELKAEVRQSVEDAGNGLGITIEQARRRHPLTI
jgi:hypothetical protein